MRHEDAKRVAKAAELGTENGEKPPTRRWVVDECPDAYGHWTIRPDDGTPNGDTEAEVIATVYDEDDARRIAAAPELAEAVNDLLAAFRDLRAGYEESELHKAPGDIERAAEVALRKAGLL